MKAICGISYKSPKHETRENRITGLQTNELLERNTTISDTETKREVSLLSLHRNCTNSTIGLDPM